MTLWTQHTSDAPATLKPEQRPHEHLRVNGRSAVVATVVVFKRLDELLEVELLVYPDEEVIGVYELPEALCDELKQRRVSAVTVRVWYRSYRRMSVPFYAGIMSAFNSSFFNRPFTVNSTLYIGVIEASRYTDALAA